MLGTGNRTLSCTTLHTGNVHDIYKLRQVVYHLHLLHQSCNIIRNFLVVPDIVVSWWRRGRQRPLTRRSETNEADEAESSRALAFTVEPSGASTRTTQVMSFT